jgi:hypothetical protein
MAEKKIFTALNLQANQIKNVGAPVNNTDVATKASAQAQADAAQSAAEATATSLASAAQAAAIAAAAADATSKANTAKSEAISAAASDATTKAAGAVSTANTYTDAKISALVADAPAALDTLKELATALGNDANFATTVATSIGLKTSKFAGTISGSPSPTADGYEYTVVHNLGKAAIVAQVFEGNDVVDVFIRKVDNNSLKVITGAALGSTELSVVVVG